MYKFYILLVKLGYFFKSDFMCIKKRANLKNFNNFLIKIILFFVCLVCVYVFIWRATENFLIHSIAVLLCCVFHDFCCGYITKTKVQNFIKLHSLLDLIIKIDADSILTLVNKQEALLICAEENIFNPYLQSIDANKQAWPPPPIFNW